MLRTRPDRYRQGKHRLRFNCLRVKPLLLASVLLSTAVSVDAQQGPIRRCIGSNGEPTFTDQPCTSAAPNFVTDAASAVISPAPITTQTCATSAEDLRARVGAAFTAHNPMTLSGLFLWDTHSGRSASTQLQELARLVSEPVIAIDVDMGVPDGAYSMDSDPRQRQSAVPLWTMMIRSVRDLDHVPHEVVTEFGLLSRSGCWWLQLPE